ncbi:hypothetical protein P4631_07855 [Halalkalibacterium halodurans]|jgi:prefoldin subunit 5|uniref:hypothetical protein n=1 Tax=Halalkalibacterium halodurans TaxID=86665 RepID=UPI002E1DDBEC|nr:hypothetical protein [Halalkalibacterium halodurans]
MYLKRIVERRLEDLDRFEKDLKNEIEHAKRHIQKANDNLDELRREREELERYL